MKRFYFLIILLLNIQSGWAQHQQAADNNTNIPIQQTKINKMEALEKINSRAAFIAFTIPGAIKQTKLTENQKNHCGFMKNTVFEILRFSDTLDTLSVTSCLTDSEKKQLDSWASRLTLLISKFQMEALKRCEGEKAKSPEDMAQVKKLYNELVAAFEQDWNSSL